MHTRLSRIFLFALALLSLIAAAGTLAANQIKTTETFIVDSEVSVNALLSQPFSFYLGDDLSGLTDPVKSAHVAVSGVYTGNGTLEVQLDANPAQQFTLANVGATPTPFEILYNATGQINPQSAGTYAYTLHLTPAGVTVYGLGAKLVETHRYKPPPCGGFSPTGYIESDTFDTGITDGAAYNSLLWNGALGGAGQNVGHVQLQIATSNSSAGPWNATDFKGPGPLCDNTAYYESAAGTPMEIDLACASMQNKQYFKYKIRICSANDCTSAGATTPTVTDVIINWSP